MDFKQLSQKAIDIRAKYSELENIKFGKEWTREQIAEGFVGDVGDLMKLIMAKNGIRNVENVDEKLAHELSDCLWSILVLSHKYEIDLEKSFIDSMNDLEKRITSEK
jgi:NTP pyrophosphatase (non-canonical NTP hydrolase)